jgi:hypothetical protein
MTFRARVTVYGSIAGALAVLYVLGLVFAPGRATRPAPLLPGLRPAAVSAVEISGAELVVLQKNAADVWVVIQGGGEFPARSERVESFLVELEQSRSVRRVTSDEELYDRFGLAQGAGTQLTLTLVGSGEAPQSVSLVVGNASAEPDLTYVRVAGEPEVWTTDGRFAFYLRQPVAYWSYLRLFPEDVLAQGIVAIEARALEGDETPFDYSLTRIVDGTDERWVRGEIPIETATPGRSVDEATVSSLVRSLADLVARQFAGSDADAALPVGRISFTMDDGREFAVELRRAGETYFALPSGPLLPGAPFGGIVYELESSAVDRLFPGDLM